MGLVDDVSKWFADIAKLLDDDPKNDIFQSGTFKGDSKAWVHFAEMIPGSNQLIRGMRIKDRVID